MGQFENIEEQALILLQGDINAFYANLDELEDSENFANWHLDLVDEDFNMIAEDVGTLTKDVISGDEYRFYGAFTVPETLTGACYYLIIIDDTYGLVKYISPKYFASSSDENTTMVRYRNDKNIFNFNYEALTSFYNQYRIACVNRQPLGRVNSIGYDLVDGSFNPIRYIKGKTREFITIWFDQDSHDAFEAATIHRTFEIVFDGAWTAFRRGSESYTIDWIDNYPLAEGTIRLERRNSFSSSQLI